MYKTVFLGLIIGLLAVLAIQLVMTGANASSFAGGSSGSLHLIDSRQAVEHINQAQAALQNGDTEGANNHLELAKQSLQGNQSGSDDSSGRSTTIISH